MEKSPMSHRMKITLPDPLMAELKELAARNGEPVARVAAEMVRRQIADRVATGPDHFDTSTLAATDDEDLDRRAPWIEPIFGASAWRMETWRSIVALHERYPRELGHLKDGWWDNTAHVETLCALVAWRKWIDQGANDPREELAFHVQLTDYAHELRQEGGGVTRAWKPAAPPDNWVY
jgi:hypothetical protein